MSPQPSFERLTTEQVIALRPAVARPAAGLLPLDVIDEWEASAPRGSPVRVRTVFLRGPECRFHCVMCDLWRFTHPGPSAPGSIAAQVLAALPAASGSCADHSEPRWLKLYNASSFFDAKNVAASELPEIAERIADFERIIVENHPRLIPWPTVSGFQQQLAGQLEIALGLETIEPSVLARLNKQMTVHDFADAAAACRLHGVDIRAFVLLRPPWLDELSAVDWCRRSIDFAIDHGARHVSVIPTRGGNGALEWLQQRGQFEPPLASSLEQVVAEYQSHPTCVVAADLWDWDKLRGTCSECSAARRARLERMNLRRVDEVAVECENCHAGIA